MTWRVSMPGLMIFSATLRRTGLGLLGHEDRAHAAFADLLQQLVGADQRAGPSSADRPPGGRRFSSKAGGSGAGSSRLIASEQFDQATPQFLVVAAGLVDI